MVLRLSDYGLCTIDVYSRHLNSQFRADSGQSGSVAGKQPEGIPVCSEKLVDRLDLL